MPCKTAVWEFDCEEDGGKKIEHTMTGSAKLTEEEVLKLHGEQFPTHIAVYWGVKED